MTKFIRCFILALLTVTALTGAVPSFAKHRHQRVAVAPAFADRSTFRALWLAQAAEQGQEAANATVIPAAETATDDPTPEAVATDAPSTDEPTAEADAPAADETSDASNTPAEEEAPEYKVRPSEEPVSDAVAASDEPAPDAITRQDEPVRVEEPGASEGADDAASNEPVAVETTVTDQDDVRREEPRTERRRRRFRFGPEVGVFLPTNERTRDRFGDSWFTFGLAFGAVGQADPKGRIEPDINFTYRKRGDDHIFAAPLGVAYRKALNSNPDASSSTYVGASANVVLADVRSEIDNVDTKLTATAGGSVFAGVSFKDTAYLEVRYRMTGKVGGFNISGTQLSAGFRF